MIKNKKLFRSDGSFRFSRKKSSSSSSDVRSNRRDRLNNTEAESSPSSSSTNVVSNNSSVSSIVKKQSASTPRAYSPSDYYYHTSTQGGINASLTPLSQHYDTNDTLLSIFSTLKEDGEQQCIAYAAGVKFVEVALFTIPKHGYFKSKKYKRRRMKSAADAVWVTRMLLDDMMENEKKMDDDTMEGGEGGGSNDGSEKMERLQKLATLAQRSFEEAVDDELNDGDGVDNNVDDDGGNQNNTTTTHCQDWDVTNQVTQFWKEYMSSSVDNMLLLQDNYCCSIFSGGGMDRDVAMEKEEELVTASGAGVVQRKSDVSKGTTGLESLQEVRQDDAIVVSRQRSLQSEFEREGSTLHQAKDRQEEQDEGAGGEQRDESAQTAPRSGMEQSQHSTSEQISIEAREEDKYDVREEGQIGESRSEELDEGLRIALSLSVADSISSTISTSDANGTAKREQPSVKKVPVAMIAKQYKDKFYSLRGEGLIHVRFLDTYQGRIADSTNGCTVVAPLMCVNYFTSEKTNNTVNNHGVWDNGLSDEMINEVIDVHTVSVLPTVRSKLGLPPDSFIVPSDVHDYLIDVGLLSTSQFVGVCGGNILDDDHIEQFKSTLLLLDDERERERLKGKRLGATFFFAGHVIAFHLINNEGCTHIELIDSLPNHETWSCRLSSDLSSSCEYREPSETSSRCSDPSDGMWERSDKLFDYEKNRNAVRVRCLDARHMDTLIRHYALAKFSDEEKKFCDEQVWLEANSSFDPRVFQAFIWAEA